MLLPSRHRDLIKLDPRIEFNVDTLSRIMAPAPARPHKCFPAL